MSLFNFGNARKQANKIKPPALEDLLHKVQQNLSANKIDAAIAEPVRLRISFITEKARIAQQFSELLIDENWEKVTYFKQGEDVCTIKGFAPVPSFKPDVIQSFLREISRKANKQNCQLLDCELVSVPLNTQPK